MVVATAGAAAVGLGLVMAVLVFGWVEVLVSGLFFIVLHS